MQAFLAGLPSLSRCEDVLSLLTEAGRSYGMDCVAVGEVSTAGSGRLRPFFYTSWPKRWFEIYVDAKIASADPVVEMARTSLLPFSWSDIRRRLERWNEAGDGLRGLDLTREFGWNDGLAIPIHGPHNYLALISFAGKQPLIDMRLRADLMVMAHHAHNRMRILHSAEQQQGREDGVLSARESSAVQLLASGMTDRQIAERLGVAERTALHYVQSARQKLGCQTRAHLIAEAVASGMLDL